MVTEFACAKINLGIDVPFRRDDGYHEVDMIMQSLSLRDTIIIEKRSSGSEVKLDIVSDEGSIDVSALPTDGSNLCIRAAKLLLEDKGIDTGMDILLIKRIPFEAGLGGGSSDAAAVLRAVNYLYELGYSLDDLMRLGAGIGADVPFCVKGGTARLKGIGERYEPMAAGASGVPLVLVKPDFGISTAAIYNTLDSVADPVHPYIDALESAVRSGSIKSIAGAMGNILEDAALPGYPMIASIKSEINSYKAAGAMMTGSGSTVFGLFEDEKDARTAAVNLKKKHPTWFIKTTTTQNKAGASP